MYASGFPKKVERMSQPSSPQRTGRRARNSLTVESILDAAEIVAVRGWDGLTIRAVAIELDASAMSLYRYFATKEDLVNALLDRVLGRFVPPQGSQDWLDELATFARRHRDLLTSHPWAVSPLFGHPSPGPNALPIGECALEILQRGGVTGEDAVAAFSGILALNYGWSSFTTARLAVQDSDLSAPDPGRFPLTTAVGDAMNRYGSDEHYERALVALLAGIEAELVPVRASQP